MIPQQERDALRAEVERLKAKLGGPDYLLKLDTYEDTIRELMHELAVRERAMEMLDARVVRVYECFDKCLKHMNETCDCTATALAQAREEIAKEAEVKPEATP
jgi:hypothetical protein